MCIRDSIYGEDSRIEYYQASRTWRDRADQQSVQLVEGSELFPVDDFGYVLGNRGQYDVCQGVRFEGQPVNGFCSGTLIDDDLILTAGHCISSCDEDTKFIFGRHFEQPGFVEPVIPHENVYSCDDVLISRDSLNTCLLYTSPSPRDATLSRMPSSA